MPSFILIHPTVWPQYTNVTDRTGQTDNSPIGQGEPFYKRSPKNRSPYANAIGLSSVCLSCSVCLSVTLVYCGQTVGWIKTPLCTEVGLGSGHIVLDGNTAPQR